MINSIFNEDCLITLDRMEDGLLDLTITSPPYNVDLGNNKKNKTPYDIYKDNKPHQEYIQWMRSIFEKVYQKTKSGGRCIINIGDGKNGEIPTHVDITNFMLDVGWSYYTTIIWHKSQIGSRTAWGSFKSPSCPSFPTPFEFILVFYKETKKLSWRGETDLESKEFIDLSNSLWNFTPETNMKKLGHPAAFPLELPRRCIKMFSWVDSVVYDPFMGIGTTPLACKMLNRKWIGSEISEEYYNISIDRLKDE